MDLKEYVRKQILEKIGSSDFKLYVYRTLGDYSDYSHAESITLSKSDEKSAIKAAEKLFKKWNDPYVVVISDKDGKSFGAYSKKGYLKNKKYNGVISEATKKFDYDYNEDKKRFAVYNIKTGSVDSNFRKEKDAIDHMNKLNKQNESIIESKDDVVSVHYMNKDKGFKADKKTFKGKSAYDDAVKWAKENLEKFSMDNIKYESVNEGIKLGHAQVRNVEKFLTGKDKEDFSKAISSGDIKTSKDLENWIKSRRKSTDESVNEGKYYISYNKGRGQGKGLFKKTYKSYKDAKSEVDRMNNVSMMHFWVSDKDMNRLDESTNEVQQLDEKLITFSNRASYGQIVFLAGGAGSGKGFAADKFIDSANFKTRDVDEMKKAVGKLDAIGKISIDKWYKKYGDSLSDRPGKSGGLSPKEHIQKFVLDKGMTISKLSKNLKNPDNVASLHYIVDSMGLKDKWLEMMLKGKGNKNTLPNLLFDITAKKVSSITKVIKPLIDAGYDAKNIHLIWILTNYNLAVDQNQKRSRVVPSDIQLVTHEGAARTVWEILTKAIPPGLNGRIDVILNNRQHTIAYTDSQGKMVRGAIKGFKSLPIKPQGGSIYPLKDWKQRLYGWIKTNAPDTVNTKDKLDNRGG